MRVRTHPAGYVSLPRRTRKAVRGVGSIFRYDDWIDVQRLERVAKVRRDLAERGHRPCKRADYRRAGRRDSLRGGVPPASP